MFLIFIEWVEFTPFEYGMAKYGVFGKTSEFGDKFYKGGLVKKFEESLLSYLQGQFSCMHELLSYKAGHYLSCIFNTIFARAMKIAHNVD